MTKFLQGDGNMVEMEGTVKDRSTPVQPRPGERVEKWSTGKHFPHLTTVFVSLTNTCNLSCTYCHEQHKRDYGRFTVEKIKAAYDFLKVSSNQPNKELNFFGGEPLIHRKLMLEFMRTHKEELEAGDIRISLSTNGILLDDDFLTEWFSYSCTGALISIDTFKKDLDTRGYTDAQLTHVREMIGKLPQDRKDKGWVEVRAVVAQEAQHAIGDFLTDLYGLGVRKMIVQPLILSNKDGYVAWRDDAWEQFTNTVENFLLSHPDLHQIEATDCIGVKKGPSCLVDSDLLTVDASGDISGCYVFVNRKEDAEGFIAGNIFTDMVFVDRLSSIRQAYMGMVDRFEECRKCDLQNTCYTCPAGHLDGDRPIYSPNGMCKKLVEFYLRIGGIVEKMKRQKSMLNLTKCRNISIYLGGNCNFDCRYCDREMIKQHVGYSVMSVDDVPNIVRFIKDVTANSSDPLYMMSFFGGEPFVFVKVMDEVIRQLTEAGWGDLRFLIQTNGSLIMKNQDFINRWGKRLHISISYDFGFQEVHRTTYDIDETLAFLKGRVNHVQMQYVVPVNRKDCFTVDKLAAVVRLYEKYQMDRLSLIPLRHLRGPGRFTTFIDEVPLEDVFRKMTQFVQLLHIYNIHVVVDGMVNAIEKSYFDEHKQLVIAPDGRLYPEFDFVEYKVVDAAIGEWRDRTVVEPVKDDSHLIHERCQTCPARNKCGIKYLYKLWADQPDANCLKASQMYEFIIRHVFKLHEVGNITPLIGIK